MFKYYNPLMDIIDTIFINIEPFFFFCHFIIIFFVTAAMKDYEYGGITSYLHINMNERNLQDKFAMKENAAGPANYFQSINKTIRKSWQSRAMFHHHINGQLLK